MTRRTPIALGAGVLVAGAAVAAIACLGSDTVTAHATPARQSASGAVLAKAKLESPRAYRLTRDAGATTGRTPDGRSFYVLSPGSAGRRKMIVTFHGYLSTAFDGYQQWAGEAKARGYGILAIQWRLGKTAADSYTPRGMYTQSRALLRRLGTGNGNALLHGYSSAASRIYGVGGIDRGRLFALYVGDAGAALPGLPGYDAVFKTSRRTLADTSWVLFCGGRDPDPQLTGCPVMRRTRDKVRARGGTIERFIVDPRSSHGGFHENAANMRAGLDVFARLSR